MADTPDAAYAAAPTVAAKAVVSVLYRDASAASVSEYVMGRAPAPFVATSAKHIMSVLGLSRTHVYRALEQLEGVEAVRPARREARGEAIEGYELPLRRTVETSPAGGNTTPKNDVSVPMRVSSQEFAAAERAVAAPIARRFRRSAERAGIEYADVEQEARRWLARAAQTYRADLGTFNDYARRWVKQGVRRMLCTGGALTTARDVSAAEHAEGAVYGGVEPDDDGDDSRPMAEQLTSIAEAGGVDLASALRLLHRRHRWLLRHHYGLGGRARRTVGSLLTQTRWTWRRTRQELADARAALLAILRPMDEVRAEGRQGPAVQDVRPDTAARRPAPSPNPLPSRKGGGAAYGGPTAGRAHARKISKKP